MGEELRAGHPELTTTVCMKKVLNTEAVSSAGPTTAFTKANSTSGTSKATGNTPGATAAHIRAYGTTTKCMEKALSNGPMVKSTKASLSRTKKRAMENFPGHKERRMTDSGRITANTARDTISREVKSGG